MADEVLFSATTILRPDEAAKRLGLSKVTLARWRCEGTGPAFVKIGPQRVGYAESVLAAWLASRVRLSTADASARMAV